MTTERLLECAFKHMRIDGALLQSLSDTLEGYVTNHEAGEDCGQCAHAKALLERVHEHLTAPSAGA